MDTLLTKKVFVGIVIIAMLAGVAVLSLRLFSTVNQTNPIALATIQFPVASDVLKPLATFHYIEIIGGCGPYYDNDTCVNMRSGPSTKYPVVARLRTGIVLKVDNITIKEKEEGREWYKIIFDKNILYPERVTGDWYVAADADLIRPFENIGDENMGTSTATTTKHIVIDLSQNILYAYDGDTLFMKEPISTGLDLTPTQVGVFRVFRKTPSRYMQGPIPGVSTQVYDLPGVPWNLYFTSGGSAIHGAYWHDHFGKPWSHGCVNLAPPNAKKLYLWADVGMKVTVKK